MFRKMALALVLCVGAVGCGAAPLRTQAAARDEDLVALLPAGCEAVFDLDLVGLRAAPLGPRLFGELPAATRQRLGLFAEEPPAGLEALALGASGLGTPTLETTLVVRGPLDIGAVRTRYQALDARARLFHYHGLELLEPPPPAPSAEALGVLGARVAVLGGRSAVRQVIDNLQGDGQGARGQAELAEALRRAPRARAGRPALWFAVLPTAALRDGLRQADLPELGADALFVSGALAVGDGIDIGLVAAYADLSAARDVARVLGERVEALRRRPAVIRLGLAPTLRELVIQAAPAGGPRKHAEVHLALRLAEADARTFLDRLDALGRTLGR